MPNVHGDLTWREIKEKIQTFTEEQLEMTATVQDYESEEYFPIRWFDVTEEDDEAEQVLGPAHPYMTYMS